MIKLWAILSNTLSLWDKIPKITSLNQEWIYLPQKYSRPIILPFMDQYLIWMGSHLQAMTRYKSKVLTAIQQHTRPPLQRSVTMANYSAFRKKIRIILFEIECIDKRLSRKTIQSSDKLKDQKICLIDPKIWILGKYLSLLTQILSST